MQKMEKKKNQTGSLALENNFDALVCLDESFAHVKFFDKNHKYTLNDEPAKISVSSVLKRYEKEFEKEKIAANVARKNGLTINEVLKDWDYKGSYSCHKGSEFHLFVENFLERKKIALDKDAFIAFLANSTAIYDENAVDKYYSEMASMIGNFINFYDWWKKDHIILKSEFVVGDVKSGICGTIDNLSYNKKTKKLVIFDYKTNKEIKKSNPWGEKLLPPFNYLQNCELVKYSFQIWLYKLIIERNSPFEVETGYVVWVSGKDDYQLFEILDVKKEAEYILDNM